MWVEDNIDKISSELMRHDKPYRTITYSFSGAFITDIMKMVFICIYIVIEDKKVKSLLFAKHSFSCQILI